MASIGERIKKARMGQGMSQAALADAANVSQPTIANWENDSHTPRQPALKRIAELLDASPHWLLSGGENENNPPLAPQNYLETPIQHVPILAWPANGGETEHLITAGEAHDYLAISTAAQKPFALIANDPAMAERFPVGSLVIFDAIAGPLEENVCYLFALGETIVLRRWQNTPDRLEALPNQIAVDAEFVTSRPVPLARALLSIRRH